MYLHGSSRINDKGHLEIGGCDTVELAKQYGTPLYVLDERYIRERMKALKQAAAQSGLSMQVAYASKALSTLAICRIVDEEGLFLDVVSGGELFTAEQAGFPSKRIYFHGNNKSIDELEMALSMGIRLFVVDNFIEMELLETLAREKKQIVSVLLRITPGVEAHTHAYIQTGQEDSKFGFALTSGLAHQAARQAHRSPYLQLEGYHCHIGSQIFELEAFSVAIEKMAHFAYQLWNEESIPCKLFNVGGGFGIRYREDDYPPTPEAFVQTIAANIKHSFARFPEYPEVWLEPGRYLVGEAGTTLYTIGTIKEIPGIRTYVSVDGGMTDNPRPALYQAEYDAILANRASESKEQLVSIAGKCCESGDMLIWDISLPTVKTGDLLAVGSTGAYNYSMASNYNRLRRPAMVLVSDGKAELIVERESYEDLISHDRIPKRLKKRQSVELC
ncbi:diaminopimelate decarboxylase [Seinonella peptonophila]|uniref:Diaminopimelate decarboxylase n=1 Tax=Seinonella peptonophila TaxID=112248 RepID=A0A1M4TJZ0_9BACL|nr:diaminopimelate decarboxylase [Seinonella peptonophila]SHE44597.1 diaminopimelate decarboxylase [Seinonella peptonophila]